VVNLDMACAVSSKSVARPTPGAADVPHPISAGRLRCWALLSVALLQLGCEEDRPYTPFEVASALPSLQARSSSSPAEPSAKPPATFSPTVPIKQTKNRVWKLAGQSIEAAPGYEIERALRADFDADGDEEVVAWIVAVDDPLKRPQLWLYPGAATAKKLFDLPGFVPTGPSCALQTQLLHTGPQTLTLDVTTVCEARLNPRAPVRSIAVVAPLRHKPVVLALRAATGGPQERFKLSINSLDRDADGRDDVMLNVSVHAGDTAVRPAIAKFLWYDREVGASRDDSEPGVSMARLASTELVRARGKNTSKSVPEVVGNLKRLYGAVCAEAGTARLFNAEGEALSCGRLTTTFSRMKRAEIMAAIKNHQVVEAVGVLVRDGWFGHQTDASESQQFQALIRAALREKPARLRRWLDVDIPRRGSHPRYSPFEFTDEAKLLVQTPSSVSSFSLSGIAEQSEEGAEAPARWPLSVVSPERRLWTGVVHSCDRSEVTLSFVGPAGAPLSNEPTRILAPRPGSCQGGAGSSYPHPVPLGWQGEKLVAWVGGSRVGPDKPQKRQPGSALSRNGLWVVYPTPLGLLIAGEKPELWQLPATLTPPQELTDCTIDNNAKLVACSLRGRAALIEAGE
jgi:hypothetical protein